MRSADLHAKFYLQTLSIYSTAVAAWHCWGCLSLPNFTLASQTYGVFVMLVLAKRADKRWEMLHGMVLQSLLLAVLEEEEWY